MTKSQYTQNKKSYTVETMRMLGTLSEDVVAVDCACAEVELRLFTTLCEEMVDGMLHTFLNL